MINYTVLGISSGLGVSLYPFKKQLIANIEGRGIFHTKNNEQWWANFDKIPLYKSIPADRFYFKPITAIISSPDCGSGSILRLSRAKKFGNHQKNVSLALFFKGIKMFYPKFFLFENLNGLFKSFPEEKFRKLLKKYNLIIHNAPVSHWGNSQIHRKRLVIVGIRKDLPWVLRKYFKLPDLRSTIKTCGELYGDLDKLPPHMSELIELGHINEPMKSIISIHARKRMSLYEIQEEWQGRLKGKMRWVVEGEKFTTAPGVYRNLDNKYPATARKANRQFGDDGYTLSPRQLARVQGIPDGFKIYMDQDKIGYWINKGRTTVTKTPPYEISVWFKVQLEKALKQIHHDKFSKV